MPVDAFAILIHRNELLGVIAKAAIFKLGFIVKRRSFPTDGSYKLFGDVQPYLRRLDCTGVQSANLL